MRSRNSWLLVAAVIVVVAAIAGFGWWQTRPTVIDAATVAAAQPDATTSSAAQAAADDRVLGKPDAPITMIEYASLTCPHCAAFDRETLPKLKEKWIDTGKAKLVYRNFPFDKPALQAAMIAACAPSDRYFNFIDVLFQQQQQWATAQDPVAALTRIAKLGGLSDAQVQSCLADKDLENKIVAGRLTAEKELGVSSTPTFFINGRKLVGAQELGKFEEALQQAAPKS
jgi:protein-disulfide isomerase